MNTQSSGEQAAAVAAATQPASAYLLAVPDDARRGLVRGWLHLGLAALLGAGVFSVLLVLSRTPYLQNLFPVADFFRVALVVHVDLSVLVWFISLAGMLWSLNSPARGMIWGRLALWLCATGAALMTLAPFVARGEVILPRSGSGDPAACKDLLSLTHFGG